jgi:hypothetical protein
MAMMSRTRDLLMEGFEGFVRDGSFKWPVPRRDDDDDPDRSPSAGKSPSVAGLSPMASAVVSRCSR